jgi:hypothetical protein
MAPTAWAWLCSGQCREPPFCINLGAPSWGAAAALPGRPLGRCLREPRSTPGCAAWPRLLKPLNWLAGPEVLVSRESSVRCCILARKTFLSQASRLYAASHRACSELPQAPRLTAVPALIGSTAMSSTREACLAGPWPLSHLSSFQEAVAHLHCTVPQRFLLPRLTEFLQEHTSSQRALQRQG